MTNLTASQILRIAERAAGRMCNRIRNENFYPYADMVQDAAVAILEGRNARFGVVDGLRRWFGGKKFHYSSQPDLRWEHFPIEPDQEAAVYVHELQSLGYKPEIVSEIHKYIWCWTDV